MDVVLKLGLSKERKDVKIMYAKHSIQEDPK